MPNEKLDSSHRSKNNYLSKNIDVNLAEIDIETFHHEDIINVFSPNGMDGGEQFASVSESLLDEITNGDIYLSHRSSEHTCNDDEWRSEMKDAALSVDSLDLSSFEENEVIVRCRENDKTKYTIAFEESSSSINTFSDSNEDEKKEKGKDKNDMSQNNYNYVTWNRIIPVSNNNNNTNNNANNTFNRDLRDPLDTHLPPPKTMLNRAKQASPIREEEESLSDSSKDVTMVSETEEPKEEIPRFNFNYRSRSVDRFMNTQSGPTYIQRVMENKKDREFGSLSSGYHSSKHGSTEWYKKGFPAYYKRGSIALTMMRSAATQVPVHIQDKQVQTDSSSVYGKNCFVFKENPRFTAINKLVTQQEKKLYVCFPNYSLPDLSFLSPVTPREEKVILSPSKFKMPPTVKGRKVRPKSCTDYENILSGRDFSRIRDWESLEVLLPNEMKDFITQLREERRFSDGKVESINKKCDLRNMRGITRSATMPCCCRVPISSNYDNNTYHSTCNCHLRCCTAKATLELDPVVDKLCQLISMGMPLKEVTNLIMCKKTSCDPIREESLEKKSSASFKELKKHWETLANTPNNSLHKMKSCKYFNDQDIQKSQRIPVKEEDNVEKNSRDLLDFSESNRLKFYKEMKFIPQAEKDKNLKNKSLPTTPISNISDETTKDLNFSKELKSIHKKDPMLEKQNILKASRPTSLITQTNNNNFKSMIPIAKGSKSPPGFKLCSPLKAKSERIKPRRKKSKYV